MMFLDGVRVLDLSRVLAGPLATQILGDMGADVLKVEAPFGDDTRRWGPPFQDDMAAYFQSCNRNKNSLVLNLKDPQDQETLRRLIQKADVLIDNFPPKVRDRLGLKSEELNRLKSDLIHLSITGYGGERIHEPGYDVMIQAESGFMGITGPKEGEPHKVGVAIVDVLTGMMSANAILAALFRREKHRVGARLDISLFQTALFSLVNVTTNHLVTGKPNRRWGNAHPNLFPYQSFEALDGPIVIGTGNNAQYKRLCSVLGITGELTELEDHQRLEQRDSLLPIIQDKLRTKTVQELLSDLRTHQIPCAPILRPDEALAQSGKWNEDTLIAVDHNQLGNIRLVNNPIQSDGMRTDHLPPPQLGEGGEAMARQWLS